MRIGTLLLGIILIVGAVFGYSFSADKVSQCQSLAGEAAQFLSPEADQNCKTFKLIQFGSYGAAAIGALLVIVGLIGSGSKKVVIKDEGGSEEEVKSSGGGRWLRYGFAGILLVGGSCFSHAIRVLVSSTCK